METTAQSEENLRIKASEHLNQGGYNTTPEDLNPNDESPLEKIKEDIGDKANDLGYALHANIEELTEGESIKTGDRLVSRNPINLAWERFKKLRLSKKAA